MLLPLIADGWADLLCEALARGERGGKSPRACSQMNRVNPEHSAFKSLSRGGHLMVGDHPLGRYMNRLESAPRSKLTSGSSGQAERRRAAGQAWHHSGCPTFAVLLGVWPDGRSRATTVPATN